MKRSLLLVVLAVITLLFMTRSQSVNVSLVGEPQFPGRYHRNIVEISRYDGFHEYVDYRTGEHFVLDGAAPMTSNILVAGYHIATTDDGSPVFQVTGLTYRESVTFDTRWNMMVPTVFEDGSALQKGEPVCIAGQMCQ